MFIEIENRCYRYSKMFADIHVNTIKITGTADALYCDEFTLLGNCGTIHNSCISIWTFTDDKNIYNRFQYNLVE